ncbi:hypothetical protein SAMN05216597_1023 [Pseudomonas cannabina]|nr:hypothetical protein SAMN05216597_1023 [Pseudomonas cannabina]
MILTDRYLNFSSEKATTFQALERIFINQPDAFL